MAGRIEGSGDVGQDCFLSFLRETERGQLSQCFSVFSMMLTNASTSIRHRYLKESELRKPTVFRFADDPIPAAVHARLGASAAALYWQAVGRHELSNRLHSPVLDHHTACRTRWGVEDGRDARAVGECGPFWETVSHT